MSETPLTNFHFQVEWGDDAKISFTEVSGLNLEHEVIEYREGNSKIYARKHVAGLRKYGNVVLKRGLFQGDNQFFDWWNKVNYEEEEDKRTVTIKHLDVNHEPDVTWILQDAWPVSVKYTGLHALKSKILIERLELTYESLSMINE